MPSSAEHDLSAVFAARLAGGLIGPPSTSLVIAEWADPGGGYDPPRYIAPLHVHQEDDEAWYVLAGALRVRLGDRDVDVPAGGAVIAPRGTPHTFRNAGDDVGRIVGTFNPPHFANYFRELAAIINSTGQSPDRQVWTELYARYDTTFYDAG